MKPKGGRLSNFPDLAGHTILQVIPSLEAGGAERTVIEMAEAITEAGGRALVTSAGGRMVPTLHSVGGEHYSTNANSKNPYVIARNGFRLAKFVERENISLIHARSRAPGWSALLAKRLTGLPFVTTYHGAYSGRSAPKRLYNSVMARGDRVIANSRWMAGHISQTHALGSDEILIIPRGVDFDLFDPDRITPAAHSATRKSWGIDGSDKRIVLYLPARLTEWKGQKLAIEALSHFSREEQAALVLVMTGAAKRKSTYKAELEELIRQHQLQRTVLLFPHSKDMPRALAACDIVLAPSIRPEAFGRTAAEAAAMGKPVIAADHGGAQETVIDGETGALFTPANAQALTGAIRSMISVGDPVRKSMGQNGRVHVLSHFSKRGLQTATLCVYSALIKQR